MGNDEDDSFRRVKSDGFEAFKLDSFGERTL